MCVCEFARARACVCVYELYICKQLFYFDLKLFFTAIHIFLRVLYFKNIVDFIKNM